MQKTEKVRRLAQGILLFSMGFTQAVLIAREMLRTLSTVENTDSHLLSCPCPSSLRHNHITQIWFCDDATGTRFTERLAGNLFRRGCQAGREDCRDDHWVTAKLQEAKGSKGRLNQTGSTAHPKLCLGQDNQHKSPQPQSSASKSPGSKIYILFLYRRDKLK